MKYNDQANKISVVLLDDHPLVRYSFQHIALRYPSIHVSGCFSRSHESMAYLLRARPDVVVLDYRLDDGELDGLALITHILASHPDVRILLVSSVVTRAIVYAAFQAGIKGYINKCEESARYFEAIYTVAAGERYYPAHADFRLPQPAATQGRDFRPDKPGSVLSWHQHLNARLTPCEAEVIGCFIQRMTAAEIAAKLQRSGKTISGHKQSAKKKLGVSSDSELLKLYADRHSKPDDS